MENSKAYDLPVRLFHWMFAILFVISFTISKLIYDHSAQYAYHMISGILMVFIVILRIVWGFAGEKTSRFNSFKLRPSDLVAYFKSVISNKSQRYLGHNPASSYAAILMMVFTLVIGFTGLMMSLRINRRFFEGIHELVANGFLVVVLFHIAGVVLHQFKHKDGMISSMFNGKKTKIDDEKEIISNHSLVAILFVIFFFGMGSYLYISYDENSGLLNAFGNELQLVKIKSPSPEVK